jgi:hypothetical protein
MSIQARKIVGYSKLNKAGLLEKLGFESARAEARPPASTPQNNNTGPAPVVAGSKPSGELQGDNVLQNSRTELAVEETPLPIPATAAVDIMARPMNDSNQSAREAPRNLSKQAHMASHPDASVSSTSSPNLRRRTASSPLAREAPDGVSAVRIAESSSRFGESDKRKLSNGEALASARQTKRTKLTPLSATPASVSVPLLHLGRHSRRPHGTSPLTLSKKKHGQTYASPSKAKKRFRGLVPNQAATLDAAAKHDQVAANDADAPSAWTSPWIVPGSHLEFASAGPLPSLQRLNLPPKIAQREHVGKLSLIFSLLGDDCLWLLSQCSKLFRYSGTIHSSFLFCAISQRVEWELSL